MELDKKSVIIAGGTTGIGRALAGQLIACGARVFIVGRDDAALQEALTSLVATGGDSKGTTADVARPEDVSRAFREAEAAFGPPDVVVCSAAVGWSLPVDSDESAWEYVIDTNLGGVIACSREAIKRMKLRTSGHLVLIGSMSAEVQEPNGSIYVASKGAVRAFAGSLRREVNPHGISVSLLEPGLTATDLHDEGAEKLHPLVGQHRALTAEQVASAVMFMLTRPAGCEVVSLQIRPRLELI